jgi:hypothetical protein
MRALSAPVQGPVIDSSSSSESAGTFKLKLEGPLLTVLNMSEAGIEAAEVGRLRPEQGDEMAPYSTGVLHKSAPGRCAYPLSPF